MNDYYDLGASEFEALKQMILATEDTELMSVFASMAFTDGTTYFIKGEFYEYAQENEFDMIWMYISSNAFSYNGPTHSVAPAWNI